MGRPVGQPTAMTVHTPCRSAGNGLHPPTGAPKPTVANDMPRRAGAKPRLVLSNEERRVINMHRNLKRYLDLPEPERMRGGTIRA